MTIKDWDFKQRVLEGNIEDQVVAWAEGNGWLVRKTAYVGRRGCPDRFFFGYGKIVMIEFKKPNGQLREDQKKEHARLRQAGLVPYVFDNVPDAIELLRSKMKCF